MLTRPQPHEAEATTNEAEATTHEAEATNHEAEATTHEAKATTHEAEATTHDNAKKLIKLGWVNTRRTAFSELPRRTGRGHFWPLDIIRYLLMAMG